MATHQPLRAGPGEARRRGSGHGRSSSAAAAFVLLGALAAAAPGRAAGDPDQAKGLVVEYCADCHRVPGYGAEGLPTVDAPSFQDFADDRETYTDARLRGFLVRPHWPMQRVRLSPRDIDNILAFVASLRAE